MPVILLKLYYAGDSSYFHNGNQFFTKNRNNDNTTSNGCAIKFIGAWRFIRRHLTDFNKRYLRKGMIDVGGITSRNWKNI